MIQTKLRALMLATAGCALLLSVPATAQDADASPRFAAPKRIQAGGAFLGEGRMYPSPVFHDVNGDGRKDIVVGDLRGAVTVAYAVLSDGITFAAETPFLDKRGKQLKFHNW